MSTNVYAKFHCAPLHIKKALGIFKGKGKRYGTWYSAAPRWTHAQECFTILEVAADWHELMIPQHIMRPYIARASKQLGP